METTNEFDVTAEEPPLAAKPVPLVSGQVVGVRVRPFTPSSWQERLLQSEQRKLEAAQIFENSALDVKVDSNLPSLVVVNEDQKAQSSEVLRYILHNGNTRVGRARDSDPRHILLNGPLIEDYHCLFQNPGSVVSVEPIAKAVTFVNGVSIAGTTVLHHGDKVVLGENHCFCFNNPQEMVAKDLLPQGASSDDFNGLPQTSCLLKGFESARKEPTIKQNLRIKISMEKQLTERKENAETADDENELLEQDLLVQKNAQLKVEFETCQGQNKELVKRMEQLEEKLVLSRMEVTSLEELVSMLQNRCSQMEDQLKRSEGERDRMREEVKIENQEAESCKGKLKEELVAAKEASQKFKGQVDLIQRQVCQAEDEKSRLRKELSVSKEHCIILESENHILNDTFLATAKRLKIQEENLVATQVKIQDLTEKLEAASSITESYKRQTALAEQKLSLSKESNVRLQSEIDLLQRKLSQMEEEAQKSSKFSEIEKGELLDRLNVSEAVAKSLEEELFASHNRLEPVNAKQEQKSNRSVDTHAQHISWNLIRHHTLTEHFGQLEPVDLTTDDDDEVFDALSTSKKERCSVCKSFQTSDHWRYHPKTSRLTCNACCGFFNAHGFDRPPELWGRPIQQRRRLNVRAQSAFD